MLEPSFLKRLALITAVITEMAVLVVVGTVAGFWLDTRFDTSPLLLTGLSLAGLILGMVGLTRRLKRLSTSEDHDDADDHDTGS